MQQTGLKFGTLVVLGLLIAIVTSCAERNQPENAAQQAETAASRQVQAIRTVLALDDSLGAVRNHAPENVSLTEAVQQYTAALDGVDFSGCPAAFTAAFRAHIDAWKKSIPFFEKFPDMRGEMHVLFDEIKASGDMHRVALAELENEIWGTWADVEEIARAHGALP